MTAYESYAALLEKLEQQYLTNSNNQLISAEARNVWHEKYQLVNTLKAAFEVAQLTNQVNAKVK